MTNLSTCAYCCVKFPKPKNKRLCCTRSCSAKLAMQTGGRATPWDDDSIELLHSVAGTVNSKNLARKFNRHAKTLGLPQRSETAITVQVKRLGLSLKAEFDDLTMRGLARLLEVRPDRVRAWCRGHSRDGRPGGLLPCRKVGYLTAIRAKDFAEFAKAHPEKLAGINPQNLSILLDAKTVQMISALPQPTSGRPYKLLDVQTGIVYESGRKAAAALHGDHHHVVEMARKGKRPYGRELKVLAIGGETVQA